MLTNAPLNINTLFKIIIVTLYVEEFSPRKVSSYLELQTTDNDIFILCFKRKPAKNI